MADNASYSDSSYFDLDQEEYSSEGQQIIAIQAVNHFVQQTSNNNNNNNNNPQIHKLCYPVNIFLNNFALSEDAIQFRCPIGNGIIRNPVIDEHGHTFCRGCINKWFLSKKTCPITQNFVSNKLQKFPLIFQAKLDKTQVKCENFEKGCEWTGALSNLEAHNDKSCIYTEIQCSHEKCQMEFIKKDSNSHKATCQFEIVQCKHCQAAKVAIRFKIQKHEQNCSFKVEICDHCQKFFKTFELLEHYKEVLLEQKQKLLQQEIQLNQLQPHQDQNIIQNQQQLNQNQIYQTSNNIFCASNEGYSQFMTQQVQKQKQQGTPQSNIFQAYEDEQLKIIQNNSSRICKNQNYLPGSNVRKRMNDF